jgi:hypothetical protein
LSAHIALLSNAKTDAAWVIEPDKPASKAVAARVEIYQDSSGGRNWNSPNHIDRFGRMTNSFRGYRVYVDKQIVDEGERAEPVVLIKGEDRAVHGAIAEFSEGYRDPGQ